MWAKARQNEEFWRGIAKPYLSDVEILISTGALYGNTQRLSSLLLCNLQRTKAIESEINLESRRYESFSVTKQKETTRSHPEHGRKDFSRRQYSEGSLPGR